MADLRGEILAEIRRLLSEELEHRGPVGPSDELARDLGIDSVGAIVLAVGLEDRFRVALDDAASSVVTVEDLVAVVASRVEARRAEAAS